MYASSLTHPITHRERESFKNSIQIFRETIDGERERFTHTQRERFTERERERERGREGESG
jgi:hypothetical protein